MLLRIWFVITCLTSLSACVSIESRDMVVMPQLSAGADGAGSQFQALAGDIPQVSVAGADRLEQLLATIDLLRSRESKPLGTHVIAAASNRTVVDTGSKTAEDLLREPAVRQVVAAMVEADRAAERGEPLERQSAISVDALFDLGHALGSARESMLDDVIRGGLRPFSELTSSEAEARSLGGTGGPSKPTLALVLATYCKALADGKFIDRRGQQIARPTFSGGIGNEALGSLVTVFFEALFDHALYDDLPLYSRPGEETVVLTPLYRGMKERKTGDHVEYVDDLVSWPDPLKLGGPGDARPKFLREVTVERSLKPGELTYLLTDGKTPTAVVAGVVRVVDFAGNPDGITESQLRAIRTISNLAGDRARGASGLVFGFLGKIDVSFVLGAGFSVGDNKTLLELVTAVADVASRRVSEWAAYSVARERNHRSDRLSGADEMVDPNPFWERINALPGGLAPAAP